MGQRYIEFHKIIDSFLSGKMQLTPEPLFYDKPAAPEVSDPDNLIIQDNDTKIRNAFVRALEEELGNLKQA